MASATHPVHLPLTVKELHAIMFAMDSFTTAVRNFPIVPDGADHETVKQERRDLYALHERIMKIGEVYGLERP